MPRLTEVQIKAGILHDDIDVRFAALHYFAECYSPDRTVMPLVIEAFERFGRDKAFRFLHPISQLSQTEATIRWAVEELKTQFRHSHYVGNIGSLLCNADPRLVQPFATEILAVSRFDQQHRERLVRRLNLLTWDGDALWRELETICEEGKTKSYAPEMRWNEAEDIVEQLGRQGVRHVDRMMDFLKQDVEEYDGNPLTWMEPLVVKLAGELQHEPAIPLIVTKMHIDGEALSEECETALVKIGGDEVIRTIRQDFATAEWHFRLYATGVLGRVHTDQAVQTIIELLPLEKSADLEVWLAEALVEHFSTEANEVARKVLLADPDLRQLRDDLVASCALTGQEFPELAEWTKDAQEEKRRKPLIYGGSDSLPPFARNPIPPKLPAPVEKKVGRNDPCPCGSGKKHKHCCLKKTRTF